MFKNITICDKCFREFNTKFIHYKISGIHATALYEYDNHFKNLLYQYKGCYDYELFRVFLEKYSIFLHYFYQGYYMVPIPSNREDDIRREYNHVVEAFSLLNLPVLRIIYKNSKYKQSDQHRKDRHKISKVLEMSDLETVKNKKILIVDDVCTTGNSLMSAVKLIRKGHPKCIRILTLAKVTNKDNQYSTITSY